LRHRLGGGGAAAHPELPGEAPLLPTIPTFGAAETGTAIESAPVAEVTSSGLQGLKDLIRQALDERSALRQSIPVAREDLDAAQRRLRRAQNWFFGIFLKRKIPERTAAVADKKAELKRQEERLAAAFIDADFALDEATSAAFDELAAAFEQVATCSRIWDVTTMGAEDRVRTRSYASTWIGRKRVLLTLADDQVLQAGTKVPCLQNANGADLLVYPAFVLMADAYDIAIIDLGEINVGYAGCRFVEEEELPADAEVLDHTWKKCNRDGSPDRRFANNYQIPVAGYGELTLSSKSGLREQYLFSNAEKAQRFAEAFAEYQSRVRALGLGSPAGDDSNDAAVVRAKKTQEPCSLKSVQLLRNVSPVSAQHTSKIMERFAREFKADVEALNGTTTPGALETLVHQVAAIPGVLGGFLNSVPVTTDLRDAALSGTTDMVRDVLAQVRTALEKSETGLDVSHALAVAREAEATLGKRKGNGSPQRRTRKRSITPPQENKAVPGANGASASEDAQEEHSDSPAESRRFAFSGFDLGFTVAGLTYKNRQQLVRERVKEGDDLVLRRDPGNEHDPNTVQVLLQDGMHLGFVPAKRDVTGNRGEGKTLVDLARAMDLGARCELSCHRIFSPEDDPSILLVYAVGRAYAVKGQ